MTTPAELVLVKTEHDRLVFDLLCDINNPSSKLGDLTITKSGIKWAGHKSKGLIPISRIELVKLKKLDGEKFEFNVFVSPNTKWNDNMRKEHPIQWRLGLIKKSKGGISTLGVLASHAAAKTVQEFLRQTGCSVEIP